MDLLFFFGGGGPNAGWVFESGRKCDGNEEDADDPEEQCQPLAEGRLRWPAGCLAIFL